MCTRGRAAAINSVYRDSDLPLYLCIRVLARIAVLVQSVCVGWQVYDLTRSPLALGIVGLIEFVPMFLLALPAGELADRFDPRRIITLASLLEAASSALLLAFVLTHQTSVWPLYAVILLYGTARGFSGPASRSLLPFLVPPQKLPRSLAWGSSVTQLAIIAGPALGGFAYALGPAIAYGGALLASLVSAGGMPFLKGRRLEPDGAARASRLERVREGIEFVRSRPVVFGAISLDLFAVLLGGAASLLPVYARDILHAGPTGLGLLRSAPAAGAAVTALYIARRPVERGVGRAMFASVVVFGIGTIVFGVSRSFGLSLAALAVTGAADQISVYIRSALVQFATPDAMRGRVSAVNTLFISASNELGGFESGVTAALIGTVPAVVLGGVGTLVVVAVWMRIFPPLRTVDRMRDVMPREGELSPEAG
ncbi:MAG: MFS transporter [Gammaproteobacteria bacterium]|nr:MFS transporter [Gammaproteobacteria bacterium]